MIFYLLFKFQKKLNIISSLSKHENVVEIFGAVTSPLALLMGNITNFFIHFILINLKEYCPDGNLETFLKKNEILPQSDVILILKGIVCGMVAIIYFFF